MVFFRTSPEKAFWKWFQKHEDMLFNFERDRESVFQALSAEMKRIHECLTFEFSPVHDDHREFVISAGGISDAFPAVQALMAAAPSLPRWRFIAFRQRHTPVSDITFEGRTVRVRDVEAAIGSDGQQLHLFLFFPAEVANDKNLMGHTGFLFLDQSLGEYDVTTNVGGIEFLAADERPDIPRFPLSELTARFDDRYSRLRSGN